MAAQGALERKQNGRQVVQKMRARMINGYWVHNAPVGYKYITEKGRGKVLVADEPNASIIKQAFEGYASGRFESQAEIKRFFESFPDFPRNKKGIITQQRVTEILGNPLYTGHICSERYEIDWLNGQHDALISIQTFDKVQARRNGTAKAPMRKNIGEDFALRGFVCCADCKTPLRSSWSKGRSKYYAYYLCQTKSCKSYGKSIARDKVENEVGAIVKDMKPHPALLDLAKTMFRHAWNQRLDQFSDVVLSAKRQIKTIDKQIESLLARIMDASNATVIKTYEEKITHFERDKLILAEQVENRLKPQGSFEEKLEPALQFLANPYKLWETGQFIMRRIVLRLAFEAPLAYHLKQGARTAELSLPFKALKENSMTKERNGAQEKKRAPFSGCFTLLHQICISSISQ